MLIIYNTEYIIINYYSILNNKKEFIPRTTHNLLL